jgi:hypothetical protein
MKYVQPYGISDPDASYINGDPSVGRMGSIPPAAAFENPMREIVGVIEKSKITPADTDLNQMAKAVRSQRMNYVEDTGSVNNLSVALDPPITAYTPGLPLRVKIYNTNTGPCTIDAGAGRVSIVRPTGAEMNPGDLPAAGLADMVYDGTRFQMINFGGSAGGAGTVTMVNVPYCVDSSPTANTIIANFSPAITSLVPGSMIMVKIANTNTTFTNINVNGLGNKPVWAQGAAATPNWPLLPSDVQAGDVLIFTYDGTRFWIYANTVLSIPSSFTVSSNSQFNDLMFALNRKRIPPTVSVTITLAIGTYGAIQTEHPNADCITVQGTLKAALPTMADFAKTGNSAAARAADSSNNIAMLRTRFGTEIHLLNSDIGINGISHVGGGTPWFKNILITGENVAAPSPGWPQNAAAPNNGASMNLQGISCWGMCSGAIGSFGASVVQADNCFVCSSQYGFGAVMGAHLTMSQCGAYGNAVTGIVVNRQGSVSMHYRPASDPTGLPPVPGCQVMFNGDTGISVSSGGQLEMDHATVTGNVTNDLMVTGMGNISGTSGSTYGTTSPPVHVTGNDNSIITY